jgi:hypothetical protein
MDNKRDAELLDALEQGLNRETECLSTDIQARLQQVRQQALLEFNTQAKTQSQSGFVNWLVNSPIFRFKQGAVLVGATVAVVLTFGTQVVINHSSDKSLSSSDVDTTNTTDVLMSNEDIEFLENMDIYEWLAAEYS